MGFFDTEEGVLEYEKLADGYDGRDLITHLQAYVAEGSSVLELGMGPGKDLDLLLESYEAVGSDSSAAFLDRYRGRGGAGEVVQLDAVALATDRKFDALYSNKVLQHLTRDEVRRSLARQAELLNPDGIALHSLWYGDKEEEHSGLRFIHYTEKTFATLMPGAFTLIDQQRYTEMEEDDSLVVVMKKKKP